MEAYFRYVQENRLGRSSNEVTMPFTHCTRSCQSLEAWQSTPGCQPIGDKDGAQYLTASLNGASALARMEYGQVFVHAILLIGVVPS